MQKIRKGDEVVVIAGKDKGRRGTVVRLLAAKAGKAGGRQARLGTSHGPKERAIVEGVNMVKRHTKPNPTRGAPGGILDKEAPIHVSNIALLNPATDKPDRVGFKVLEDGRKVRFFKSNGEVVDA